MEYPHTTQGIVKFVNNKTTSNKVNSIFLGIGKNIYYN